MSSPCDPKNPRTKGSPSLLWPPHPSWKLCWHQCTESLLPPYPLPEHIRPSGRKRIQKCYFYKGALYSVRKTQKQRLYNSRTNLRGFRNGNYWLWKHWLSRQSSTNYPDPFSLALSLSLVILQEKQLRPWHSSGWPVSEAHVSTFSDTWCLQESGPLWQLSVNRGKSKELRERSLHCDFAAQISRENRQVPQPLCLSGASL